MEVPKEASYSYDFDATDDEGDTYTFSLPIGPSWASIDSSTGVLSGTAPDDVGALDTFKVVVTDGALSSDFTFYVRIQPENVAPTLNPLDDVDLVAGTTLRVDARGDDANGDDLAYSLDSASETLGLTINSLGQITWDTDDSDITSAPHTVTVTVDDSRATVNESFDLTVSADTTGPEVTVVADRASLDIGEFVNLHVDALDDVAVADRTLTLVSVTDPSDNTTVLDESLPLGTGHTHRFDVLIEHFGELTFRATAVDAAGNITTSDDVTVQVSDPDDTTRPQVDLFPPTPQGDREQGVVIAPTDLWGTVTDDGSQLSWELTVTPLGPNGGSAQTVASGNSEIPDADVLHRFDPTMLADGSYRVELIANDGTNEGRDSLILTVQGRLKLGNFDLSFTDMEIPVAGIPITVRRSYDTLDSQTSGDFGYGWDLEIVQPKISVDMSTTGRTPARINGRGYPSFVDGTRVTVTTPDGTEEGFEFEWNEVGFGFWSTGTNTYNPTFVSDSGRYELIPPGAKEQFNQFYMSGQNDYSALANWYGSFVLKEVGPGTRGLMYTIEPETGIANGIEDEYGNKLRFDTDRYGEIEAIRSVVVASDGVETNRGRSIDIDRDWRGNISTITDPRGYELRYEYDHAGRLSAFYNRRATDKLDSGEPAQPTRFEYDPGFGEDSENYLTKIIDPLGQTALSAQYDPESGRLIALTDAEGNPANLDYDIDSLSVTSESGSGTTETTLDDFGNPVRQVNEAGQVTLTTYDDPARGRPASVTQVIGALDTPAEIAAGTGDDLVTSFEYHAQRTVETDPRGNTTETVYRTDGYPDFELDTFGNKTDYSFVDGQLFSTTDADGNVSQFSYDDFGNVTMVTQSNLAAGTSSSTSFDYNMFGDLVETTDADGNVREIDYNDVGDQVGTSFTWTNPANPTDTQTLTTSVDVGPDGAIDGNLDATGQSTQTLYDDLSRPVVQIDENGHRTTTVYDKRGLVIETRAEATDEDGDLVTRLSRTVYDDAGRAVWTTGNFTTDADPTEVTGTRTVYDDAGRVERTEQYIGVDIDIVGQATGLSSVPASAGTLVSFSSTTYDDDTNRVTQSIDSHGRRTQTLYGRFGDVVESRRETVDSDGTHRWLTTRTVYDSHGRAAISTSPFLMPIGTTLGIGTSPQTELTKTVYDDRGRTVATETYTGATVSLTPDAALDYSPQPVVTDFGDLESVSETLYDDAGRVWRTISGRVPTSSLNAASSGTDAFQTLPSEYPSHGDDPDPYASENLTSGRITDTLFDSRGRQHATLGHPVPAGQLGLSGGDYNGNLVRHRSETVYDSYGQTSIQRSGLAHIVAPDGTQVSIDDSNLIETHHQYDAFGNATRSEWHSESGPHSYTLTRYDDENRPVAEMQQTDALVEASWSASEDSFVVSAVPDPNDTGYDVDDIVPTTLRHYDDDDRLASVQLPAVPDPDNADALTRPTYEYAYDEQGNQTFIRDPLGHETRFTFTDRGMQATRTLPLGFGDDGILGTADDPSLSDPNPDSPLPLTEGVLGVRAGIEGSFAEGFTYDDRGRETLHVSFECYRPNCGRILCRIVAVGIWGLWRAFCRIAENFGEGFRGVGSTPTAECAGCA